MAFGDSKNGGRELQALLIISPQRFGFNENADLPNRDKVGVTGIGPVRLLPETLNITRNDWLRGGSVPLNRFHSSLREYNLSKPVKLTGIKPVRLL